MQVFRDGNYSRRDPFYLIFPSVKPPAKCGFSETICSPLTKSKFPLECGNPDTGIVAYNAATEN